MSMGKISIRRGEPRDCSFAERLLNNILEQHRAGRPDIFSEAEGKYSEDEFKSLCKDKNAVVFIAEIDGEPAGYLICKIITQRQNPVLRNIKTLYLDDLCVDSRMRGLGAGRALMEAAESFARENGFYNITLNVWEFNGGAREFYEKLGYFTQRREMEKLV